MSLESPTRTALAGRVAEFAAALDPADVPDEVLERARHLVLDAVGLAYASTAYRFSGVARDALATFGGGDHPVLGMPDRLSPRDAAVLNGVLVHGMDFDDTHIPAVTHVSAAALPAALSAATVAGASTREMLLAYVLGVEVSARVGLGGAGGFHDVGFHPTAVAGAFGAAVAAGPARPGWTPTGSSPRRASSGRCRRGCWSSSRTGRGPSACTRAGRRCAG